MTFDQLADRTPEESASVAMQLSLTLSAAERAKDLTQEAVCVEGFKRVTLGRSRPEKSARGLSSGSRIQGCGCLKMGGRSTPVLNEWLTPYWYENISMIHAREG